MIISSPLKEKIGQGRPVMGTWFTLGSPLVAEMLARSGLDFLVIDFEHGPFQIDRVHDYVHRCERYECAPIVRIPSNESWMILQALDQGAHGVIVPHIDDAASARRVTDAMKYHPAGRRGFSPFTKAGGFSNERGPAYPEAANNLTLGVALVESREGLDSLDEILEVKGIDVVYFGAYDLSQAFGAVGNVKHPDITSALSDAAARVTAAGKCPGGWVAQSREDVKWQIDHGMRFITFDVDSHVLLSAFTDVTEWFKGMS